MSGLNGLLFILSISLYILVVDSIKRPQLYHETKTSSYYLVYEDDSYCLIKDAYTLAALGYENSKYTSVESMKNTDYHQNTVLACPMSLSSYENKNICDTYHKIAIDKTKMLTNDVNSKIITSMQMIGEYFNPSFLPNGKKLLMIRRQMVDNTLETIDYDFKNINLFNFQVDHPLTKYETDIRLFRKTNGNILLVISNYYEMYYHVYTGIRELKYNSEKKSYSLTNQLMLDFNSSTTQIRSKNWSPFNYNNEVYLVTRLFPLTIYKLPETNEQHEGMFMNEIKDSRYVYPVNTITCDIRTYSKLNHWEYGDIRGGTPAVFIANLGYLAFFHSTYTYCNNSYRTYLMGAYVISSTYPFKVIRISTNPIVNKDLIYNPIEGPRGQSIIFPMSYYLLDKKNNTIDASISKPDKVILSIGYRDDYAIVLNLNFDELVNSLSDLIC